MRFVEIDMRKVEIKHEAFGRSMSEMEPTRKRGFFFTHL